MVGTNCAYRPYIGRHGEFIIVNTVEIKIIQGRDAGRSFVLEPNSTTTLGRSDQVDVHLDDPSISRVHMELLQEEGKVFVKDLGSSYGVFVNSVKVDRSELENGHCIVVGDTELEVIIKKSSEFPFIEGYEITGKIGAGGMGAVFKALSKEDGRPVALKVINFLKAPPRKMIDMFQREAWTTNRFNHPNVVKIHHVGESNGIHFIAMEYIPGRPFDAIIKEKGMLGLRGAMSVGAQVSEVLKEAEKLGIVHRDIKPANLMLTTKDLVKVLDFGLAKQFDDAGLSGLTKSGSTKGTVDYMSPEQIEDAKNVDPRTDQYALGATLYHMLAGRPRHGEGGIRDRMIKTCTQDPEPLSTVAQNIPLAVDQTIMKMMSRDPDDRFQTPDEFTKIFKAILGSLPAE
jgi:serine/threonine protein kinase